MLYPDDNRDVEVTVDGVKWFIANYDFIGDDEGNYCWIADPDNSPSCWTDGVCWAFNSNLEPSIPVVEWRENKGNSK